MRSSATRGTGQLRLTGLILASAILVVSRARALGRYHGSAQRILRRAFHRKCRALVRLFESLQNEAADALGGFLRRLAGEREALVGIVFLEACAQLEAAGGNFSQAAPLPRSYFEDFGDRLLRRAIPFPPYRARILIFDFVAALFELADRHVNALEQIEGLEPGHHDGYFVLLRDWIIFLETHHRADVSGGEKSLHDAL